MLSEKFIAKIKKVLLNEKKRLEKEIEEYKKFPEIGTSTEDSALEVEAFGENLALDEKLSRELRRVDSALERIEKGTYGKCTRCKKAIPEERLEAYPAAKLCLSCAEKAKKGEI